MAIGAIIWWWKGRKPKSPPDTLGIELQTLPRDRSQNTSDVGDSRRSNDADDLAVSIEQSLYRAGYWSMAAFITHCLLLLGITTLTLSIYLITLTKANAEKTNPKSINSLPLLTATCDSQSLRSYGILCRVLLAVVGGLAIGSSNYLQQICTSPTFSDIKREIFAGRDVKFGSNMPGALLQPQRYASLIVFWAILASTTVPIQLALDATIGSAFLPVATNHVGIRASDVKHQTALRVAFNTRDLGSGYTELQWELINSTWDLVSSDRCRELYNIPSYALQNIDRVPQNVVVVMEDGGFDLQQSSAYSEYGYLEVDFKKLFRWPSDPFVQSCYVEFTPTVCHLTIRWLPCLVFSLAIVIKAIVSEFALWFHPHFRFRAFNCLGDVLWLSAKHPELASKLPRMRHLRITGRRKVSWYQSLTTMDYSVIVLWWACILRLIWLGLDGMYLNPTGVNFKPTTSISLPFNSAVLVANVPKVWVAVAYFVWNNQISRFSMEMEWRSYYLHRRRPRVSYDIDEPGVETTSWLQLPFSLSTLLIVLSMALHWVVSHAISEEEVIRNGINVQLSAGASIITALFSGLLVSAVTILYFIPIVTWMPLMGGSVRVVLYFASRLEPMLPAGGIAWGDISSQSVFLAGFGDSPKEMHHDIVYPSVIDTRVDVYESIPGYGPNVQTLGSEVYLS